MFLNNRHYDPTTGIFISVDPLVSKTMEPYIYGAANPVTMSDPSGLETCHINDDNTIGVCWDEAERETSSVWERYRWLLDKLKVKPKATYDKKSKTTRYENIPSPLQSAVQGDDAVAWDSGHSGQYVNGAFLSLLNGTRNHSKGSALTLDPFDGCNWACAVATGTTGLLAGSTAGAVCLFTGPFGCGGATFAAGGVTSLVYEATSTQADGGDLVCSFFLGPTDPAAGVVITGGMGIQSAGAAGLSGAADIGIAVSKSYGYGAARSGASSVAGLC